MRFVGRRIEVSLVPSSPSALAIKLLTFGKLALVQLGKAGSETSVNVRSSRLDDDCDMIVVTVAEPVEGHVNQWEVDYKAK